MPPLACSTVCAWDQMCEGEAGLAGEKSDHLRVVGVDLYSRHVQEQLHMTLCLCITLSTAHCSDTTQHTFLVCPSVSPPSSPITFLPTYLVLSNDSNGGGRSPRSNCRKMNLQLPSSLSGLPPSKELTRKTYTKQRARVGQASSMVPVFLLCLVCHVHMYTAQG